MGVIDEQQRRVASHSLEEFEAKRVTPTTSSLCLRRRLLSLRVLGLGLID